MAKYPLIILLCSLGAMMLFQPELLCKLISFFVVKNSEPSDYRLSFVRCAVFFVSSPLCCLPFFCKVGYFPPFPMENVENTPTPFSISEKSCPSLAENLQSSNRLLYTKNKSTDGTKRRRKKRNRF